MTNAPLMKAALNKGPNRFNQASQTQKINVPMMWSILVAAPAYLAVWIVRAEVAWFPLYIWSLCVATTTAISLIAWAFHRRSPEKITATRWHHGVIAGAASVPWIIHFVYCWLQYANGWNYGGEAMEILALASLQNITLALALVSSTPNNRRLTITSSFFLMLFAIVISSKTWVYPVAAIYGVVAVWWLMGDYWDRLQSRFIGQTKSSSLPVRGGVFLGATVFLCCIAALTVAVSPSSVGLTGWLPTSGGKSWADPSSRNGIGDGDMLVAASDQAFSFGPVESDLFIEDKQPSLYDMISEMDGLPPKKKKAESAVGIDAALGKTNHEKLANSQASSREFSTIRQAPNVDRKKLSDKDSPSLIYYSGPVPQRLALETYENFDGITWTSHEVPAAGGSEAPAEVEPMAIQGPPVTRLVQRFGKPWIQFRQPLQTQDNFQKNLQNRSSEKPSKSEALRPHWVGAIKIIRLVSPRIPTPDEFDALHIDRIDRPEFFDRTSDGIAMMVDREQVPSLTTVRIDALQRNLHAFRDNNIAPTLGSERVARDNEIVNQTPSKNTASKVDEVARRWTDEIEFGWRKIEAIETRLRNEFELDPQAIVPETSTEPVEHFLTVRRGPSYMFATTAATMIRSLGYPCRLANGFYIDDDTFDAASGQHLIGKKQLHWWPQVCVDGVTWISIEPTPGYFSPSESWTMYQRCHWALMNVAHWLRSHPWQLLIACLAIFASYRWRIRILDLTYTLVAKGMGVRSLEEKVSWSLWLLDRRAELAGCPRPPSKTPRQWYQSIPIAIESTKATDPLNAIASINDVLTAQDERLYSPGHRIVSFSHPSSNQTERLLRSVKMTAIHWTVQRLRAGNASMQSASSKGVSNQTQTSSSR